MNPQRTTSDLPSSATLGLPEPNFHHEVDAWWRAANYLSVGQIYLRDNPLCERPLTLADIKPRLLGHWGTTPGLNLVYAHCQRIIRERNCPMVFVAGPGHGGPAVAANAWLDGSFADVDARFSRDREGMANLFQQFSFPGGIPSHAAPDIPGSMHEGGELGYALSHAYGAVFDNPDLVAVCVVGDGEAETGPTATAWHSTKFLNPRRDGAVLPVLHLNGYKIANPSLLARITGRELRELFRGYGYEPWIVETDEAEDAHRKMIEAMDGCMDEIQSIQSQARSGERFIRRAWPMIILRSPKGWTGPAKVDGVAVTGTARSHQVPLKDFDGNPDHVAQLETWLRSYRPAELFGSDGRILPVLETQIPPADLRLGVRPETNGGEITDLDLPVQQTHAIEVSEPGQTNAGATAILGGYLREVIRKNPQTFRLFGPDETASNRLGSVFEVTARTWMDEILPSDDNLSKDGRVMEILSEHTCEGWLEGYLLTGRHGLLTSYEAFVQIISSMVGQHAKWLTATREIPWRKQLPSLNILLTSHVWRQDHNGFSHQDPGFVDFLVNKRSEVVRAYFPPDANCLLSVMAHCLRSRHYVNVVVAGKQAEPQWLDHESAQRHCAAGIGRWTWAEAHPDRVPDLVLACAGDVPTMEVIAAASILRHHLPDLAFRVVNIVDLLRLPTPDLHPHGLDAESWAALFPADTPVVFAYHGYPWLIHRLAYRRPDHADFHVHGYLEEGSTTTPLDMLVRNKIDRFHLVLNVLARCPGASRDPGKAAELLARMQACLDVHEIHTRQQGTDLPAVRDWQWPQDASDELFGL